MIGYYFDQSGNIIADSVWVDVRDECEINVKVSKQNTGIKVSPSEGKNKQNFSLCAISYVCLLAVRMHVKNPSMPVHACTGVSCYFMYY